MIDNDGDKADGELRAMLATMVNDPVLDAIRTNSDALANRMSESVKSESELILMKLREIANGVKELPDELDTLRSKIDQALKGTESLKTIGAATKAELEHGFAKVVSRLDINANAVEALPMRVREVMADDFADGKRRLDEAVSTLSSMTEAAKHASSTALQDIAALLTRAEKERADSYEAYIKTLRGLRFQVGLWAALSVLGAFGIAILLIQSFRH